MPTRWRHDKLNGGSGKYTGIVDMDAGRGTAVSEDGGTVRLGATIFVRERTTEKRRRGVATSDVDWLGVSTN